jgi:hypothetical protein
MHPKLLVLSCSQLKRSNLGALPAIDRYDGVAFRLLRKVRREGHWPQNLDVFVLSAKYGLITDSTIIFNYDQRMTKERASELKEEALQLLREYRQHYVCNEIYVNVGKDYWKALRGIDEIFTGALVIHARGRIGERLAQLKHWIVTKHKESPLCVSA